MSDGNTGKEAVSLRDVTFSYGADGDTTAIPVFTGLNLSIKTGQTVGIVGRNGSGKSTLLKLIRGALAPDTGRVALFSRMVAEAGVLHSRPKVSLISQRPDASLGPTMTVFENYLLARHGSRPSLRWAFTRKEREKCLALVRRAGVSLEDKLDEQIRFLSGGQQQALSVLLGLMLDDPILLMDEPTASLDPISADKVLDLAAEYVRERQGLATIVSHRLAELLPRCDSIIILIDGKAEHRYRHDSEWTMEAFRQAL